MHAATRALEERPEHIDLTHRRHVAGVRNLLRMGEGHLVVDGSSRPRGTFRGEGLRGVQSLRPPSRITACSFEQLSNQTGFGVNQASEEMERLDFGSIDGTRFSPQHSSLHGRVACKLERRNRTIRGAGSHYVYNETSL